MIQTFIPIIGHVNLYTKGAELWKFENSLFKIKSFSDIEFENIFKHLNKYEA